tara:strand:- start:201 stop:578 length:378 start_codon:yes stop_codon:yes gene_type:complete
MATITLTFANKINESAQVGDTAYYTPTTDVGDFKTSLKADEVTENTYIQIGTIRSIASNRLSMVCNTNLTTSQIPTTSYFIFFSKDNVVNMSSALGYYAEVKLKSNSTTDAELFSVACDIFESSK